MLLCRVVHRAASGDVVPNRVHQEKDMPNIATVLKEEILRLARKEVRKQTNVLRKASAQYRKDIAEMKRRVSDLQRKVSPLEKQVLKNASVPDRRS